MSRVFGVSFIHLTVQRGTDSVILTVTNTVPSITSWLHTFSPYQSQWSVKDHLWSTGSVNPCCFEDSWHSMGKIIQKNK